MESFGFDIITCDIYVSTFYLFVFFVTRYCKNICIEVFNRSSCKIIFYFFVNFLLVDSL
jgi:hypothetical protein